ncbi:MAG TPA: dihydroorotate dehydrogenase [Acidobacteriota bacterium]|nr:dihydroorotate dehydrogenase [Acidobacteriota bacterium]
MSNPGGKVDLSVKIGEIELSNPMMLASGTVGYGEELAELIDLNQLGGIVVKGLSMEPERGNTPQRIAEVPGGMLNSIGLQNVGAEAFVRDKLPFLRQFDLKVIANAWGRTVDEYVGVVARLDQAEGVHAIELNVSCPNIKEGGISFGTDPVQIHTVTAAARSATSKPLWVKLAPGVTDIGVMARAAEEAGADALSVANTIRGMAVNVGRRRPLLATIYGGLSGPALFPIALYLLYEVSLVSSLPLIGIGGVSELDHVLQYLIVGATAVQIGTANFYDPTASQRLVDELERWCCDEEITSVHEVVGSLRLGES